MNKKLPVFIAVSGSVLFVFILKAILLITCYGITASSTRCEYNETTGVEPKVSDEYVFTIVVYAILNMLRILEYILLAKQFYIFLFEQDKVNATAFFNKHSRRFFYLLLFSIFLLPYFLLGVTIPGLGIYQEIEHNKQLARCSRHYYEIYLAYCCVNFLRYMAAYTVRILMIYTALSLNKIWFPDQEPPLHTSLGLVHYYKEGEEEDVPNHHSDSEDCEAVASGEGVTNYCSDGEDSDSIAGEHPRLKKILNDWKVVSTDYQRRAKNYHEVGKQADAVQELFQTWFIVLWIVYFVASSLKTYNILRPWNADGDGDMPPADIPQIYYLFYNVNQFITLIIPYLCAKKINTYHQKYFKLMRQHQLKKFEDDPSRLSFARQLIVERDIEYDFLPRIIGTSITISIGSPLYVIILLAGIFLSVSESLL